MTAHRRLALVLAALVGGASLPAMTPGAAAEDPPPPPAAPASAAPGAAVPDPAALAELKKEIEDTYLQVQHDFDALTGSAAADTIAALEAAVAEEARVRGGAAVATGDFPSLWTKKKVLGPVVAARLAAHLPEAKTRASEEKSGEATTLGDALRIAAKLVFPEAAMADNWDHHFTDLEVVRRWVAARGSVAPEPARVVEATDPADMVPVPKGDLLVPDQRGRGWPNAAQKAEKRSVKAFYIDRTEVTGAAYAAFLRELKGPKVLKFLPAGWKVDEKGVVAAPDGSASLPVTGVTYEGARAFAESLGKRLPSEDEWERAARGPQGLRFPWGAEPGEGNAVVGGKAGPAAAGSTAGDRSPFGAMDMAGNVSELCATLPDGKAVKGLPPATEQVVIRGGNFKDPIEESANDWRYVIGPTARSEKVGFRCAMDEKEFERRYQKK